DRQRLSHDIAVNAREILKPIADELGAKIQIVEMPPGPPVLQTVVAEIYGPDAKTRQQVAKDMTVIFESAEGVVDVDNYMADEYEYWRFEVDTKKAARRGISVNTINKTLAMVMGGYKLGDVKKGRMLEATYIVIQAPLGVRSEINRLGNMPITGVNGETIPLTELGRFVRATEDPIVYHKDLRDVEYVTGEMTGRLGAPIYGMFGIEDLLENYITPDGEKITGMPLGLLGPPADDFKSAFEWGGEWTVTYETFRDMGGAFMAAMLLIYGLIVWEFKDFSLGGLIMAPIPLTLIGIIPGHWITGAEFTATSMIGFIALAGIVVRNSILLVEFVKHEVEKGIEIHDAIINAGKARIRPILITALTLMAGSYMILDDLIFKGMAVSLLFGAGVATVLTLVVIPLGCISLKKHFYECAGPNGEKVIHRVDEDEIEEFKLPLWMRIYSAVISAATWIFYIGRMLVMVVKMAFDNFAGRFKTAPVSESFVTEPAVDLNSEDSSNTKQTEDAVESKAKKPTNETDKNATSEKKSSRKKAVKKKAAPKKTAAKKSAKPKPKKRRGIQLKDDKDENNKD
ncbi:Acriflavin resistance protein, partial [hydrothermal vent metagenome]